MKELRGYVMILGSAVFWGTSATAAKALFNQQLDTVLVVQARVTVSIALLLLFYLFFRRDFLRMDPRELWKFALLGCIGVAGTNYTYYFTIKETTVATAILIQYTAPLLVMLYAVWSGEERFTSAKVVAVVLSLGGCFLAVGAYDTGSAPDHAPGSADRHRIDLRVCISDHIHAVRAEDTRCLDEHVLRHALRVAVLGGAESSLGHCGAAVDGPHLGCVDCACSRLPVDSPDALFRRSAPDRAFPGDHHQHI